ncbi:MAG: hypothetical protein HY905_07995 [Deltaproteobacteria bacterium]|nr:hypothetical protein [Deltaproteobacteria bacterium]
MRRTPSKPVLRRDVRSTLVPLACFLSAAAAAGNARAATDRVVDVVIAAMPDDAAALEDALREPLERQGVRLRWMRVEWFELSAVVVPDASAPPAAARAWFDLVGISRRAVEPDRPAAVVYLVDGPWDHVLVRTVPLDAGLDEVARQELAEILASGVEGIIAGAAPGRSREEVRLELGVAAPVEPPVEPLSPDAPPVELPLPPPEPPEPAFADRFALELGAGYELSGVSSGAAVAHGFELRLGLAQREGGMRFGGSVSGAYRLPLEAAGEAVGVRLDIGSIRARVFLDFPFGSWFVLRAGVGAGLDLARVEPRQTQDSDLQLAPVGYEAAGVLQAAVGGGIALGQGIGLWLGLGIDIDVAHRRYVVDRGGPREVVLEPWPVRPFGSVAVAFDLLARGSAD